MKILIKIHKFLKFIFNKIHLFLYVKHRIFLILVYIYNIRIIMMGLFAILYLENLTIPSSQLHLIPSN